MYNQNSPNTSGKNAGLMTKMKRYFRFHYLKTLRIKSTPDEIARGVFLGVYFEVLLTFGLGFLIAFALARHFQASRIAAVTSALLTKPFLPFALVVNAFIGAKILGYNSDVIANKIQTMDGMALYASLGSKVFISSALGSVFTAFIAAVIMFYITRKAVNIYQNRKRSVKSLIKTKKYTKEQAREVCKSNIQDV